MVACLVVGLLLVLVGLRLEAAPFIGAAFALAIVSMSVKDDGK
jgi:uncharacterized membrane-anchored protein